MDTILGLFDTSSKRWLAALVASVVASVVVLVNGFLNALAPSANTVTAPPSTSSRSEEVQSRSEPAWGNQRQAQETEDSPTVTRVSPFDNKRPMIRRTDPVVKQEVVHQQADYLRKLITAGKLPKGLGNLTIEQVDEMEKKGITID